MVRLLLVVALGVLVAQTAYAQPSSTFESWTVADEWAARVADWRFSGNVSLGLTISVAFFGLAVGALQVLKGRSPKIAAGVLSAVITFLTLVNSETFDVGHRTYRRAADAAEPKIEEIRRWVVKYDDDEERREAIAIVRKLIVELKGINERLTAGSSGAAEASEQTNLWLPDFIPRALAQSKPGAPGWTRGRAPEGDRIYFVGVGLDSSLSVAKRISQENAQAAVRDDLTGRLPAGQGFDAEALSDYLAEAAVPVETYFERDPGTSQYRYYSLVSLSRSGIETDARLFGYREKVNVPGAAVRSAQAVRASSADYQLKRQEVYAALSRNAQLQVPADVYRAYEAARSARVAGNPRLAVPALETVVKRSPTFFMAWYNLALASSAAGDRVKAEEAYKRAIALEPSQPVRDPSVYNSYGHLLLQQGRKPEARAALEKALEIDPKHPMAVRNLEAAKTR
jgi:tetratricopeptide (TPR) repeat protein